jgi:hypothetical protein
MNKILLITAGLLLVPLPALSQTASESDDRGWMSDKQDRELEELLRSIGDEASGSGPRRGAAFVLRRGDASVAVRCDPRESMSKCVDLTTSLLEKARTAMPSGGGTPPGPTPPQP